MINFSKLSAKELKLNEKKQQKAPKIMNKIKTDVDMIDHKGLIRGDLQKITHLITFHQIFFIFCKIFGTL